jgi:replicative DNA helicase
MTLPHTDKFVSLLKGVRETSNGWEARCPCRNDDDNPSLSISEDATTGNVLVTCHRGSPCTTKEICESVGIQQSALFSPSKQVKEKLELVKTYDYNDENGKLLFQKLRYVDGYGKKTFRQRKPDGRGGWEYSLGDTPKILYNLASVIKGVQEGFPIWVVEGEKDADTLIKLGIIATTMPGGAGKWLDIHTQALAGADVEIIADNDKPGIEHAQKVLQELSKAGCTVNTWVSPNAKDVTEHLGMGGTLDDFIPLADSVAPPEEVPEELPSVSVFTEAKTKLEALLVRTDLTPQQVLIKAQDIALLASRDRPVDFGRLVDWSTFVNEGGDDSYDWVIDELIERGERVMIVAAEGVGKTMLARQVAILSGCGIHPFTYQKMKQIRTLTVDLENPERIIRRTSSAIFQTAMSRGYTKSPTAKLLVKPSGLDLLKPEDRMVLETAIEQTEPELLVMGPLYKAFVDPGGRTSEAVAVEVARYLDHVRETYKCALWLEHHAPLGESMSNRQMRPFGSAVWSRWPEFGISLTPDLTAGGPHIYDVRHFRGARDERPFPTKIRRGKLFPFEVVEYAKVNK